MATTIKVPKEVMEVFYEMLALEELMNSSGFFKQLHYRTKYKKAYSLAWRALHAAHPSTAKGEWFLNQVNGTVTLLEPQAPKKTRTRKPKAAPLVPSTVTDTKGEVK